MKNWFILFMIMLVSIMTSCAENVTSSNDGGDDTVLIDSVDINDSIDSVVAPVLKTFVIQAKAVKGPLKNGATISSTIIGGDSYDGLIGDYSEGTIIVVDTSKLSALEKDKAGEKLMKTTITGSALNEYGGSISFNDIILESYQIIGDEDTVDIKINVVDHLITAAMNEIETIEAYEEAKSIVLADLNLDSTFALNATFDDADVSDKDAGAMIAIGGLMMRSTKDVFGVMIRNTVDSVPLFVEYGEPISPSDWDLLPYENINNPTQSFKYWVTELSSGISGDPSILDSTELKEIRQDQFNIEFSSICENAQSMVNSLDSNGYRNLSRFNISDEVTNSCIDYLETFFWNRVN